MMSRIKKNKILNSIIIVLLIIEYSYLVAFYSFVIRAREVLYRWPTYENPDPKFLHFDLHREFVADSFTYTFISVIIILLLFITAKFLKIGISKIYWILYLLGIFLILYNLFLDPFFVWFAD